MAENNYNNSQTFQREEENAIQLADLWAMIWDNKWWYVISVAVCIFFAGIYLYRTPDTYNRKAKVLIDESNQDATMRNLGVASAGMMRLRSFNSVENEIEAFSSPDLMQTVVERLGLETRYVEQQFLRKVELYRNSPVEMRLAGDNPHSGFSFEIENRKDGNVELSDFMIKGEKVKVKVSGRLGDTLQTPVGAVIIYPTENIENFDDAIRISWANSMATAKAYCSKLNISLSGKESSVIVLSMNDTYPNRSSAVLNTLIDVYNEVWINNKNRSAINTTEFINERLVIIEKELATVEDALKNYKSSNNLTDIKAVAQTYLDESSHYATKAFEVNNQLSIAQFIKDYLNDPANSMSLIPSNLGLTSSSVEAQIGEYNDIVLQRDRLLTGSGENNPLIADLNSALAAIRSAVLRSIENLITTLELQLSKIDSQEKQILERMSSSSGQELQLLSIERQQQITQQLYMFLLQKREENELAALVNVGNTRVIMTPNGSGSPVAPNKMMILFAALVLGCGIPFAFFFLKKMLDTSVKNKADLGHLSVPFLAEIPQFTSKTRNLAESPIIVEQGKRDMMNEAFRVLRTNVDLMIGKNESSKVIMFTSFNPGAGKTFSIMNMAASMALKDSKVLLVDLDLRKASLSKSLNINHSGVAAYLNGKSDSYQECVDHVSDNLYVLPVGTLPPNPTELLLSKRFVKMLEQMRTEYDYIFLDCPPIDIVADSNIVTEYVDMTVLVMRANLINKAVLPVIEELYRSEKFSHMALILNGVELQYKKYGYGKAGYGYGYGYSNDEN
ncbi:MAG: polysaccharide biosynthesis tyrosine autokinase [Bacteroidales bacterium]|nr:polysaccharide biosynthesis tyrosine autokinase [Bacteroidales bacterium]